MILQMEATYWLKHTLLTYLDFTNCAILKPPVFKYGPSYCHVLLFGARNDYIWMIQWVGLHLVLTIFKQEKMVACLAKNIWGKKKNRQCSNTNLVQIWSALLSLTVSSEICEPDVLGWTESLRMSCQSQVIPKAYMLCLTACFHWARLWHFLAAMRSTELIEAVLDNAWFHQKCGRAFQKCPRSRSPLSSAENTQLTSHV